MTEPKPSEILKNAIVNSDTDQILEYFTLDNISCSILELMMSNPSLCPVFEILIENNLELHTKICDIVSWMNLSANAYLPFLDIMLKYPVIDRVINSIVYYGIGSDNIILLDFLFMRGYDIKPGLDW